MNNAQTSSQLRMSESFFYHSHLDEDCSHLDTLLGFILLCKHSYGNNVLALCMSGRNKTYKYGFKYLFTKPKQKFCQNRKLVTVKGCDLVRSV